MVKVNIVEAGQRLEELLTRAEAGETVLIERPGHAAVRLALEPVVSAQPTPRFDAENIRARLAQLPMDPRSPETIIAERKEFERY